MSICEGCLHKEVCGLEGSYDEALKFCDDYMGWIPVSKKLPETDEFRTEFIVTIRCDTWEENKTMVAEWENTTVRGKDVSRWIWCNRLIPYGWEVIAWMSLPEAYREDGDTDD